MLGRNLEGNKLEAEQSIDLLLAEHRVLGLSGARTESGKSPANRSTSLINTHAIWSFERCMHILKGGFISVNLPHCRLHTRLQGRNSSDVLMR